MWIYRIRKGHLPPGTLVQFLPPSVWSQRRGAFVADSSKTKTVGVVIGGWKYFRSPGRADHGSIVLVAEKRRYMHNEDLEVLDA